MISNVATTYAPKVLTYRCRLEVQDLDSADGQPLERDRRHRVPIDARNLEKPPRSTMESNAAHLLADRMDSRCGSLGFHRRCEKSS